MPSQYRFLSPLLFLALFCATPAQAEVYKYYDSNGNLVLSDALPKDHVNKAEKIQAREVMTIPALKTSRLPAPAAAKTDKKKPPAAYTIMVQSPNAGATYQRLGDAIPIALSVAPSLADGHKLTVTLDGAALAAKTASIAPLDLARGEHSVVVSVVDAKGTAVSSAAVTFYVQQIHKKH